MFKDGDWVILNSTNDLGKIIDVDDPVYIVEWVTRNRRKAIGKSLVNVRMIRPAPLELGPFSEEDLKFLIDWALVTKNRDWFLELTEQLKK